MRFFSIVFCLLLQFDFAAAQEMKKIQLLDQRTGVPIENASITSEKQNFFATSNQKGTVELPISENQSLLFIIRHLAYQEKVIAASQIKSCIKLQSLQVNLENVTISAVQQQRKAKSMGAIVISAKEMEALPMQLGELDVLKILETQPGVFRTNELNPAINVRGGDGAHNSFRLDGQPIFNPNHLLGIMSTFNPDLLEQVNMTKDAFLPHLGGSLASYINVKNRIGDKKEWKGKLGIGLLSSRFSLEGPLKKEQSSFLFGFRRSYFDFISKSYNNLYEGEEDFSPLPEYNFYDLQIKIHTRIKNTSFIDIDAFRSSDHLNLIEEGEIKSMKTAWSNQFVSTHYKYYGETGLELHMNSGFGKYRFKLNRDHTENIHVDNNTLLWNNQLEVKYKRSSLLAFSFGFYCDMNWYEYQNREKEQSVIIKEFIDTKDALYAGTFGNIETKPFRNLVLNTGIRFNSFKNGNHFFDFSPRISMTYNYKEHTSFHVSYSQIQQYNHLISTYGMNLPNDIWYPSDSSIPAEEAIQYSFGIRHYFSEQISSSFSIYNKKMDHLIDYKDGADVLFDPIEDIVLLGEGQSRGIEFELNLIQKKYSANVYYTLADTWRKFKEINSGNRFNPPFDVKHNLNCIFSYQLSNQLSLSLSWYYASGQSISFPAGAMLMQGAGLDQANSKLIPIYGDRYNLKMPDTHRLDFSFKYQKKRKRGKSIWSFGIYNVYNQSNPYFIYYESEKNEEGLLQIYPKQKALIPFLPTINYTYEFH